jgi:hypothetical protein
MELGIADPRANSKSQRGIGSGRRTLLLRSQAGSAHQMRCNSWILAVGDIPGHDHAAPDIDHQVHSLNLFRW